MGNSKYPSIQFRNLNKNNKKLTSVWTTVTLYVPAGEVGNDYPRPSLLICKLQTFANKNPNTWQVQPHIPSDGNYKPVSSTLSQLQSLQTLKAIRLELTPCLTGNLKHTITYVHSTQRRLEASN